MLRIVESSKRRKYFPLIKMTLNFSKAKKDRSRVTYKQKISHQREHILVSRFFQKEKIREGNIQREKLTEIKRERKREKNKAHHQ